MIDQIFQIGLTIGSTALAVFCFVLARRLKRLNNLETGLGSAIAVMTAEITRLESAIIAARTEAIRATDTLSAEVEKAKNERAFWVLQNSFAPTPGSAQTAAAPAETSAAARTAADLGLTMIQTPAGSAPRRRRRRLRPVRSHEVRDAA